MRDIKYNQGVRWELIETPPQDGATTLLIVLPSNRSWCLIVRSGSKKVEKCQLKFF